jgi:hypothetical protein
MLESLATKIHAQFIEQDKAILVDSAATRSLHDHLVRMQASISAALPELGILKPEAPLRGNTSPLTGRKPRGQFPSVR